MANELLPCPFCGGPAEIYNPFHMIGKPSQPATYRGGVRCRACGCESKATTPPDGAITTWNRRADAAPQASAENVRNGESEKRHCAINFDDWLATHCDSDDLTAYERELALDAWNAAMASHQDEPVDLPRIDADRLRAIAASGSHIAMSNALLNVARALKTRADKDGGQQRAGDAIRDLIEKHAELLESSDYVYFELARTRQTGWMAWLCSHPVETNPDRKVLARGQGVTPDEACRAAMADFDARSALSAPQAEQGERDE